jgi:hypothetical protein
MAQGGNFLTPAVGLVATGDLSTSQYKVVKYGSTAGTVKVASTSTDAMAGVLQNEPASGEAALVACLGVCKAQAEASVTAGCFVTASSTGRVKKTTTDHDYVIGKALEASSSAGDIIQVLVAPATISA